MNPDIHRIVPNIYSNDLEKSKAFYTGFLGLELAMDMGWVMTFVSKNNHAVQLTVLQNEQGKTFQNESIFVSVEVSDVNALFAKAKELHCDITYPLTDEPWGVRRFFVKDPNGATINILSHLR